MRKSFNKLDPNAPPRSDAEWLKDARNWALRRLTVREYAAREMLAYLERKQVPSEIAIQIISQLTEEKLLDDRRYARAATRSQSIRGKGPAYILMKLKQKGVRIELDEVRTIFSETSDQNELEMARNLVERRYPRAQSDTKELRRAYAALLRRGFSTEVVRECLFNKK